MRRFIYIVATAASACAARQGREPAAAPATVPPHAPLNLAERLGFSKDARVLIVNADDLGQNHSINAASFKALEVGPVNSGSIHVPCPWLAEVVTWAKQHPAADLGLQFTLSSEWNAVRWGPVLPRTQVPSLVDAEGYFFHGPEAAAQMSPAEAEAEMRAQFDRLLAMGVKPTYVDTHISVNFKTRPLFDAYLRVAHDYGVPAMILRKQLTADSPLASAVGPDDIVIDGKLGLGQKPPSPAQWGDFFSGMVKNLAPGVYILVVHIAYDDAEMRATAGGQENWGSAWRQRNFDYFTSGAFNNVLADNHVERTTWRDIAKLMRPSAARH